MEHLYLKEFDILKNYIFLDHAAVSPIPERCVKAGYQYYNELSQHSHTHLNKWFEKRNNVKKMLAKMLECSNDEIAITKNTTEGILHIVNSLDWHSGDNVILFSNEYPANVYPWLNLERQNVEIRFVPETDNKFLIEDIENQIDSHTRLLSVSFVEFSTGYKNNLLEIGKLCKRKNIIFVVDAVQALGAIPIDVKKFNIDFLSAGGHKWLMAGTGIGCFYANLASISKLKNHNFSFGGVENPHNDFLNYHHPPKPTAARFEEGMFNLGGLYTLEASLELLLEIGIEEIYKHLIVLTDHIINGITTKGYKLLTPVEKEHRSGIISFYSDKFDTNDIISILSKNNIIVSNRRDCIRVSPHFYNTIDHINEMLKLLPEA
ncbi:MAG: aminotransferase class V-fold PLP-dependent enzyme [Spirochaetota bacterium]|nr:aminotransferase class V-fold PLP-dependent enzyme [Spirochaetota bacterium]